MKTVRQSAFVGEEMEGQRFGSLEDALISLFGSSVKIVRRDRLFGGDINEAYGLTLTDGTHIFMKENKTAGASFFAKEAEGLEAIMRTGMIGVPRVLGIGSSFLLLEFIESKKRQPDYWEVFAQQLAAMHQAETADFVQGGNYGFTSDNYIGANEQVNTAHKSWISFYRDCRLKPQFARAKRYFDREDCKRISALLDHLEDILVEPEHPSLLHGDLWSGNVITGKDGKAWLIDPAVYVGHAEADIAMTELFGGFPQRFYEAYVEAAPLQPGYKRRRKMYQLYHLLNHLNLFGRSYLSAVREVIAQY